MILLWFLGSNLEISSDGTPVTQIIIVPPEMAVHRLEHVEVRNFSLSQLTFYPIPNTHFHFLLSHFTFDYLWFQVRVSASCEYCGDLVFSLVSPSNTSSTLIGVRGIQQRLEICSLFFFLLT